MKLSCAMSMSEYLLCYQVKKLYNVSCAMSMSEYFCATKLSHALSEYAMKLSCAM